MEDNKELRLIPISNKGKNRVREIKKKHNDWDNKTWFIVQENEQVLFSETLGPWYLIVPIVDKEIGIRSEFVRWIHKHNDINFKIEKD